MTPTPDSPGRDRIRRTLDATATGLDLDLAEPAEIAGRGRRRRRHRRLLGGGAVVALAIGSAVVLTSGSDDSTVSTSQSTPPTSTSDSTPPTSTATATTGAQPAAPTTVRSPATAPPTTADATNATGVAAGPNAVTIEMVATGPPITELGPVVPFGDGFAMVTTTSTTRPLPDRLPADVRDLFSEDAIALFADGLPPTIEEATSVLEAAGLLDEVTEVITNHPEAYEAIYGSGPLPRTSTIWATEDGSAWTRSELPFDMAYPEVAASGDTLAVWSALHDDPASKVTIAATDDLTNWRLADVDLDVDLSAPAHVTATPWIEGVAVVDDRWYAIVTTSHQVEWLSLLPASTTAAIGDQGFSVSFGDERFVVEYLNIDGVAVTESFGYDDVGLSGDPFADLASGLRPTLLSGSFGDDSAPAVLELPDGDAQPIARTLMATDTNELLYVGDAVYRSADGRSWVPVDGFPDDVFFTGAVPLDDDALVLARGASARPRLFRLGGDGGVAELEAPDLGDGYSLWDGQPSAAWIVDATPEYVPEPVEFELEHNGFHYQIVDDHETFTISVIDLATGEVVVDRVVPIDERRALFDALASGERSAVPVTDDAGNVIDQLPADLLVDAYVSAGQSEPVDVDDDSVVTDAVPDRWLIATADGIEWLTVDLADHFREPDFWIGLAVADDERLLMFDKGEWVVEMLP